MRPSYWPALRALHEQHERNQHQKQDSEKLEDPDKRHHRGLTLDHPEERRVRTAGRGRHIGPRGHEGRAHARNRRLRGRIVRRHMRSKRTAQEPRTSYDQVMRALLVEDDASIADFVIRGLKEAGFAVDHAADGEAGLKAAVDQPYDVAIVDLMLPRRDGLSLIEELRRRGIATPVLILSARRTVDDRVRGLQTGGDDYLTKPFAFAELLARVQALVRRATRAPEPTTLTVDDVVLDLLSRRVTRSGTVLDLRPREFALLEYLMRNVGHVVSKTMILSHVWDYSFDPQTNVVDVLVSRLREKIDRPFEKKLLHTVRGVGYVLRP